MTDEMRRKRKREGRGKGKRAKGRASPSHCLFVFKGRQPMQPTALPRQFCHCLFLPVFLFALLHVCLNCPIPAVPPSDRPAAACFEREGEKEGRHEIGGMVGGINEPCYSHYCYFYYYLL